jgi:hypothetical protein
VDVVAAMHLVPTVPLVSGMHVVAARRHLMSGMLPVGRGHLEAVVSLVSHLAFSRLAANTPHQYDAAAAGGPVAG